jgi:hypothetical protein
VMCGLVHYRDAETTLHAICRTVSSETHRATSAKLAHRNDHRTHQISLRVTLGCFLLLKWASRRRVSQQWRTSNRMWWPNSGRFQKKPSAGASNNGRINGASVCVCVCARTCARVLLWRWLGKHCHMSYRYSAIPHFQELFDCPSYSVKEEDRQVLGSCLLRIRWNIGMRSLSGILMYGMLQNSAMFQDK